MRVYTTQHPFSWGIDLQARAMSVCILGHAGAMLVHRHLNAAPEPVLKAVAPDREGLVGAVEWTLHRPWARRAL